VSATVGPQKCPYVGLDPFESAYAEYFFGRRQESKVIADHVLARPVTVLYGPSGIGKSSILNVGLPAALEQIAVAAREESEPADSTNAPSVADRTNGEFRVRLWRDWQHPSRAEQQITAWAAETTGRPVLIIFDQFEEYFLYRESMSALDRALSNLAARRDRAVHLLFAVRDDALHLLDQLRAFVPSILETTIELRGLSDSGIRDAICGPIKRYNEQYRQHGTPITVEDGLVATLVSQLKEADTVIGKARPTPRADRRVELPYLQLALTKLWEAEDGAAATALRQSTLIHRLGGVRQIVREHVSGVMGNLSGAEQALCARLFDRLVTAIGGKIAYPTAALAAPEVVGPKVSERAVEAVLNKLTGKEQRILKPVMTNGGEGFEIFHDVLGLPVLEWKRSFEARLKEASLIRLRVLVFLLLVATVAGAAVWWNQVWLSDRIYAFRNVHALTAEQEVALKPVGSFKECTDCPKMVVVPAGTFTMGSPPTEASSVGQEDYANAIKENRDAYSDEMPVHAVKIAYSFAVSSHDITFDEWDACVAHHGCNGYRPYDERWGRGRRPVINVTWNDAQQYVAWLFKLTAKPYRLLTEAEYEYATRAGTTRAFPWGDEIKLNGQAMANCDGCGSRWDNRQTAPVGSFSPNKFGLYDMVGNVWGWVEDCYTSNYEHAPLDGSAIPSSNCEDYVPGSQYHVLRGGSWYNRPINIRSAMRASGPQPPRPVANARPEMIGFRVARTLFVR
jgi:formylglycine-generating enzyme required for sulfatase activity